MSNSAIVLIDGNNLYHNLKSCHIEPGMVNMELLSDFVCKHFHYNREKTLYYNSIPSIEDGKDIYFAHLKFLEDLRKLKNFEVKTRKLQRLSNKEKLQIVRKELESLDLCEVCEPIVKKHWEDYIGNISIKEKGIDIMIATDIIKFLLLTKECDACILISGDADFVPALELVKNNGKKVYTSCLYKGYSNELRQKYPYFVLDKKIIMENCSK